MDLFEPLCAQTTARNITPQLNIRNIDLLFHFIVAPL